jgi:hypothetical protein
LALIGAAWALFFLLVLAAFFALRFTPGLADAFGLGSAPGPAWWQLALMIALLPPAVTAPFGTTILGCIALSHIRHSGGRFCGLGLALFDALLFPLLALDGFIFWAADEAVNVFLYHGDLWAFRAAPGGTAFDRLMPLLVLISLVLDALLVWWAWRRAKQPLAGAAPPAPRA